MLDYVNLLVEFVIISVPILSHKENYYISISSNCEFIGGGGGGGDCYIYIYIYGYNLFVLVYNDDVVLVWMIEYSTSLFLLSVLYVGCCPIFKGQ